MSLLLKALKQAETAKAAAPDALATAAPEFDPPPPPPQAAPRPREWVEPPNLLLGASERRASPAHGALAPRIGLVPAAAAFAAAIAIGYGIYLYFALRPVPVPSAPPVPERAVDLVAQPTVASFAETAAPVADAPPLAFAPPPPAPAAAAPRPRPARLDETSEARPAPRAEPPALFQPDTPATLLDQAYAAYQHGALDEALRLYTRAAARGRSADALLGLATIAALQNRDADAAALYREVLDVDPHNAVAQAALIDFLATPDRGAAEARLKALIAREPSAQLYQSLGHLYAEQGRWNDAQAAYFEAYRRAPDSPDYAYNLAVGLDRLRQYAAALTYYEKALAGPGSARFDRARAEARVGQLKPLVSPRDGTP